MEEEEGEEEKLEDGEMRTVLRFAPRVAPIKIAVFPLMKKDGLGEKAKEIYHNLMQHWNAEYDEGGAIGKRYRRQDEIGTPFCVTVDYDTLQDNTVTIRERDSMKQERIFISQLKTYFMDKIV